MVLKNSLLSLDTCSYGSFILFWTSLQVKFATAGIIFWAPAISKENNTVPQELSIFYFLFGFKFAICSMHLCYGTCIN